MRKILSMGLVLLMYALAFSAIPFPAMDVFADTLSGSCGETVNWALDTETGVLDIIGTGDMEDYASSGSHPWKSNRSLIKTVNIANGVTSIGKNAFAFCPAITSVAIPNSVTSIGDSAFDNCTALADITIPNSVTSVGSYAFYYCTALTRISIGAGVTSIGNYAFTRCFASVYIDSATIVNGLTSYYANGSLCNFAKAIMIKDGISDIPEHVTTNYTYTETFICNDTTYNSYSDHKHKWNANIGYQLCNVCGAKQDITVPVIGDTNGDGYVDNTDASAVLKYDAGILDLTAEQLTAADVNNDGNVDNTDAAFILKYDAGIIPDFE